MRSPKNPPTAQQGGRNIVAEYHAAVAREAAEAVAESRSPVSDASTAVWASDAARVARVTELRGR